MQKPPRRRVSYPLLKHVDELMDGLRANVPAALKEFDVKGIHQARVGTRKLKAALDLMKPVLSKRERSPLARGLKRLRRRLGPLRDADVMLEHLAELGQSRKHQVAAAWVTKELEGERERLRTESNESATPQRVLAKLAPWWNVREEMAEAAEAVDTLLAESLHLQIDAFAEQADRLAEEFHNRRSGQAGANASTTLVTEPSSVAASEPASQQDDSSSAAIASAERQDPHAVRIAGKALRYTLEMADAEGHAPPGSILKTFKKMQEQLGAWHDFVVLTDRILGAVVARQLAHHDACLSEQVLDLARTSLRRSAQSLDGFVDLWSEKGEPLAKRIRESFPLTRAVATPPAPADEAAHAETSTDPGSATPADVTPVDAPITESKTDPDPSGSAAPEAPPACPPVEPSAA